MTILGKMMIAALTAALCSCDQSSSSRGAAKPAAEKKPDKISITLDKVTQDSVVVDGRILNEEEFAKFARAASGASHLPIQLHYYGNDAISKEEEEDLLAALSKWKRVAGASGAFMQHPRHAND